MKYLQTLVFIPRESIRVIKLFNNNTCVILKEVGDFIYNFQRYYFNGHIFIKLMMMLLYFCFY